jgi:chemosensory pili system protein ChpA (sensor histidine kinase/response regulator)
MPEEIDLLPESIIDSVVAAPSVSVIQTGEALKEIDVDISRDVERIAETVRSDRDDIQSAGVDWLSLVEQREDMLDREMFEIFHQEAEDLFVEIDECLSGLALNLGDKKLSNRLKRAVHTLKGSANTAGARKVGALFHYLEDLMESAPSINREMTQTLQAGVDAGFAAIKAVAEDKSVSAALRGLAKATKAKTGEAAETVGSSITETQSVESSVVATSTGTSVPATHDSGSSSTSGATTKSKRKGRGAGKDEDDDQLRVSAKLVDTMINAVGEINIARNRISSTVDETKGTLTELSNSMSQLSSLVRRVELEAEKQMLTGSGHSVRKSDFDHLQMDRFTLLQELTRRLAEVQNDIATHHQHANNLVREMEDTIASQYVAIGGLSANMDHIRQLRVSSIVPAMKRVVRQACRDTEKQGEIYFDADVSIDRGILNKINGSLEHILRNAVAHGIESSEERESAGKDPVGAIEFRAYQDGGEIVIQIRDDGAGINHSKVLSRAISRGIVPAGTVLPENKITELLFEPGFSTAESVTDIAGRGVGLDVVRSDISSMGGRIEITSQDGAGTTFTLRVPATLSVISGTGVSTNGHDYVIPVGFIDRLIRVDSDVVQSGYRDGKISVEGADGVCHDYEFWGLWQLAGAKEAVAPTGRSSVLLLRGERIALHVEGVTPAAEYVFRPMGPQISPDSGLIGSTITPAGNASLVLDPTRVSKALRSIGADGAVEERVAPAEPLVLIVDDSLTVRSATARLLKKHGYRFMMANDGQQALDKLREERPDVVLMDIEMPNMNGYEATQEIRNDGALKDLPVIMITSRVGDAFREKALEIGVNEYLGKPYKDDELISLIGRYAKRGSAAND